MPDDQNTDQNPSPEENSVPVSPQEPTQDAPIPPTGSAPADMPSVAPESSKEAVTAVPVGRSKWSGKSVRKP